MINFKELANALEAHPDIWLARAQFLPGASVAAIEKAERNLGAPLHPELKAFYSHHNGLAIEWMFKQSDRFQGREYEVDTSELPFCMDLLEDYGHPFDGQIIVLPLEDVFIRSYNDIEEESPFAPEIAFMEYIERPDEPSSEPFLFGTQTFESETAFRAQLRYFDFYARDDGNLMLFEQGQSNPTLLNLEDHWTNFDPRCTLPLSQYLHRIAYDFGLRGGPRYHYFRRPKLVPTSFDAKTRLAQFIDENTFWGDLRKGKN